MAVDDGEHQCGETVFRVMIEFGAAIDEQTEYPKLTGVGGKHQRRLAVSVERIDFGPIVEQSR